MCGGAYGAQAPIPFGTSPTPAAEGGPPAATRTGPPLLLLPPPLQSDVEAAGVGALAGSAEEEAEECGRPGEAEGGADDPPSVDPWLMESSSAEA
jgi:hypothetical protein